MDLDFWGVSGGEKRILYLNNLSIEYLGPFRGGQKPNLIAEFYSIQVINMICETVCALIRLCLCLGWYVQM